MPPVPCPAILLLEVGNALGFSRYSVNRNKQVQRAFERDFAAALNENLPKSCKPINRDYREQYFQQHATPLSTSATTTLLVPLKLPPDTHPNENPQDYNYAHIKTKYPLPENMLNAKPLKYDWKMFAYTDGSVMDYEGAMHRQVATGTVITDPITKQTCQPPLIGSGLYAHKDAAGEHEHHHADLCLRILPVLDPSAMHSNNDSDEPNCKHEATINRAELVPIQEAIDRGYTHIATDSLTSMYQIKKAIYRPQDIKEHRHVSLLQGIAGTIQQQGRIIHIYKVKSHIGIIGNERADTFATSVASASAALTPYDITVTDPSNNRNHEHWVYASSHQASAANVSQLKTSSTTAPKPLPRY